MVNDKVVEIFGEIADMLEILGESRFRVNAYRRAENVIRGLAEDLEEMHSYDDEIIEDLPGIGKDLHEKIVEIIETGECEMHKRLVKKLSPRVLEILRVRGIGPKKVKLFYEQLDIDNVSKLRAAAESGALAGLPGMGEKSQEAVLKSLDQATHLKERIPLKAAKKAAAEYLKYMRKCETVGQMEVAGSLRRERETIGDVDILVTGKRASKSAAAAMSKHFLAYPKIKQVLAQGETKSSVVIEYARGKLAQVDFRVVDPESFGAALFYFTGPKDFNIKVRTIALRRGLKINEYGVFRGEEKIAGKTEKEIFDLLEVKYLEPKERERF